MLNYTDQGQGPAVILIHGLFGAKSNLQLCARHLIEEGFRVICVDCRNHGESPRIDAMTYQQQAGDIIELCDFLSLSHYSLLGHSMGGKVAMAAAQLRPESVEKLVVADIAPVPYQASHQQVFQGLKSVVLDEVSSRSAADKDLAKHIQMPEVRQFLLRSLVKQDQQWRWAFDIPNLEQHYGEILDWKPLDKPYLGACLFIKGSESDYIQSKYQTQTMQQFPNAELKIIQDAGHWLHAQKPSLFNRISVQFLRKAA